MVGASLHNHSEALETVFNKMEHEKKHQEVSMSRLPFIQTLVLEQTKIPPLLEEGA